MWPRVTSSIESAITSRETSLARIPSVPIVTPSEIAIVLNSIGVPPAARTPRFTSSASSRWLRLHGIVSVQVVTTPMIGFARSSSVKPTAFSIDRAPARSGPSRIAALRLVTARSYALLPDRRFGLGVEEVQPLGVEATRSGSPVLAGCAG